MKSIKYILLAASLLVLTFILPINVRAAEQYYTITFLDYEGNISKQESVELGRKVNPPDGKRNGYFLLKWIEASTGRGYVPPDLPPAYQDETYTPFYYKECHVLYLNYDGTTYGTFDLYDDGTKPDYIGVEPMRRPDEKYTYTFIGWRDTETGEIFQTGEVPAPHGDKIYMAEFNAVEKPVQTCTIIFKNHDGSILQSKTLKIGDVVSYDGQAPSRKSDQEYTYSFSGWNTQIVSPCTGDAEYIASYSKTKKEVEEKYYQIVFKKADGTILKSLNLKEGSSVDQPLVKDETVAGYLYKFTNWTPEFSNVAKSNVTYTAVYTPTKIEPDKPIEEEKEPEKKEEKPEEKPEEAKPEITVVKPTAVTPTPTKEVKKEKAPKKETVVYTETPKEEKEEPQQKKTAKVIAGISAGAVTLGVIATGIFKGWWILLFNLLIPLKDKVKAWWEERR